MLAGADLEIKDALGNKPLARLENGPPELVTTIEKIKAAVPQVKQERAKKRTHTTALVTTLVSSGPAGIIAQYTFEPVWDKESWLLFQQYMAK